MSREIRPQVCSRRSGDVVKALSDFANKQGTFMICGSQRMAEQLAEMVATQTNKSRAECISAGTWLEDCY